MPTSITNGPEWAVLATFFHDTDLKLHELSEKAARAADESSLTVYFALKELEERWEKSQASLLKQVESLNALEQSAHTASDTAKVKAHLAKADVLTAAHDARERLRKIERRLHDLKSKAESDSIKVLTRISDSCKALSARLG